jgi:anaerobic selenocysteine-containing dehydrogenase
MTQPLNNSPLHDGAAGAKETERDAVMIDSRTAMKAGALALLGLSANALFRGLLSVANASEDSSAPSSSRAAGPSDARVGELAMASVAGYKGKSGTWRNGVPTSCVQCVAICTIIGYEENGKIVKIEGNPDGPNNGGCICAKAQAGVNQVYDPDRLLYPLVRTGKRGEGKWKRISMDEALDLAVNGGAIAGRQVTGLKAIYESGKPEEFMLHYGRNRIKGPLEHFCKAAFGTGTIGNHTSICEGAKFVGQEVSMGKSFDVNDVEHSKYVLILGANILEAHTSHSYFAQRLTAARAAGARVVTFDVRLSNTAAKSDEWVPVLPGTDLAVILAMTNVVLTEQPEGKPLYDEAFVNKWTNVTIDELKEHYARYTPAWA